MKNTEEKAVLVTGAAGMIGSQLVQALLDSGIPVIGIDRSPARIQAEGYIHEVVDLGDMQALQSIFEGRQISRVIHLAALAHTDGESDLSYEKYYHVNVICAKNVFSAAAQTQIPVLFISTVDVLGFTKDTVNAATQLCPVTAYGKTKALAESEVKQICADSGYTIFRFAPVYTETVQRDIQKRYYLKYPDIAYLIGKGTEYEVLNIHLAVQSMVAWTQETADNDIYFIKDPDRMHTADKIAAEKEQGRAKFVLRFPRWMVRCGFAAIKGLTGENKHTYLLNKAVNPLRTE